MNESPKPGVDTFWQQADRSASAQDPLEREMEERIDALARYRRLIADAVANGRDDAAEILTRQRDREQEAVRRLREALAHQRGED